MDKWFIVILVLGVMAGFSIAKYITGIYQLNIDTLEMEKYDMLSPIACGSDSMGLSFRCGDMLYLEYIGQSSELQIGKIYTYKQGNSSIVHRLVECMDNCSIAIFKGDNNPIGEKVNRSQITALVKGVRYG